MSRHIDEGALTDYLDGSLPAAQRREVDDHLESCQVCRAELEAASEAKLAVESLPVEAVLPRDLWVGIRERMEDEPVEGVLAIERARTTDPRRVSLSLPQLAAASVLLMLATGSAVLLGVRATASPGVPALRSFARSEALADFQFTSLQPVILDSEAAAADLSEVLEEGRDLLDPETLEVVEESLRTIESAIREVREALAADPASEVLHQRLTDHMRQRLNVLRRATAVIYSAG